MVKYTEHIHWGWWWLELGELVCPSCCNKRLVCTCNELLQNGSLEEWKNGRIAGWEHLWWKNGMAFFSFCTFSASVPSLHFGSSDQVIKLVQQNISVTNPLRKLQQSCSRELEACTLIGITLLVFHPLQVWSLRKQLIATEIVSTCAHIRTHTVKMI